MGVLQMKNAAPLSMTYVGWISVLQFVLSIAFVYLEAPRALSFLFDAFLSVPQVNNRFVFLEEVRGGWGEAYLASIALYIAACCAQVVALLVAGGRRSLFEEADRLLKDGRPGFRVFCGASVIFIQLYVVFMYDIGGFDGYIRMRVVLYPWTFQLLCAMCSFVTAPIVYILICYIVMIAGRIRGML